MKVVTIGGGTGSPVIIRSLISAGVTPITAICAAMDSGGKTGNIRSDERDRVIAISDLLRNLLSLLTPTDNHHPQVAALTEILNFIDGRNRNLGYTIYYALLEKYHNDFSQVQSHFERLLGIKFKGEAIPISLTPTNIYFSTDTNEEFKGEHELDRQSMSANMVTDIWIDPKVHATAQAVDVIKTADLVIYSPGSLYGSLLVNFLPTGVRRAMKETSAYKVMVTNLSSNRNQTHNFKPDTYWKILKRYTGASRPMDAIIAPNLSQIEFERQYPEIASSYAREHSHFLGWEESEFKNLKKKGVKVIRADIFSITPDLARLRHDPEKLAKVFKDLI